MSCTINPWYKACSARPTCSTTKIWSKNITAPCSLIQWPVFNACFQFALIRTWVETVEIGKQFKNMLGGGVKDGTSNKNKMRLSAMETNIITTKLLTFSFASVSGSLNSSWHYIWMETWLVVMSSFRSPWFKSREQLECSVNGMHICYVSGNC